jgi:putative component of toxin-antitoxin plasmid stabilization module
MDKLSHFLLNVLSRHDNLCLDNAQEREIIAKALAKAIVEGWGDCQSCGDTSCELRADLGGGICLECMPYSLVPRKENK